jgi:hypothetical protein
MQIALPRLLQVTSRERNTQLCAPQQHDNSTPTFLICRPDSLRVEIFADLDSIGVNSGSNEFAVGVVVSAFLFTPFFTYTYKQ